MREENRSKKNVQTPIFIFLNERSKEFKHTYA